MTRIRVLQISGATYPVNVFISDINLNNLTQIGIINSGPVPPEVVYTSEIPSIFYTAPEIMFILVDSNGCEVFKKIQCTDVVNILAYQNNIEFRLQDNSFLLIQI